MILMPINSLNASTIQATLELTAFIAKINTFLALVDIYHNYKRWLLNLCLR